MGAQAKRSTQDSPPPRPRPSDIPPGRHRLPRELVIASQRRRLIAATAELVGRHGYEAVSVADVAQLAGVSKKSYYAIFEGREASFIACLEDGVRSLVATVEVHGAEDDDGRLDAQVGRLLDALAADPLTAQICFLDAAMAGPQVERRRSALMLELVAALVPRQSGSATRLSGLIEANIAGALTEVLQRELRAGRAASLPALAGELAALVGSLSPEGQMARASRASSNPRQP